MIVHQIFAQIKSSEVRNIIVCDNFEVANKLAKAAYGNDAFAVDCLQYSCRVGDKYHDDNFFRVGIDGNEILIKCKPTAEQQIKDLLTRVEYLSMMLDVDQEVVNE
jgi:hypothetical protein